MASSTPIKQLTPGVRQVLQQPAAVSAIASFGVHLLLFAVLPVLPHAAFTESEPDIRRSVEVVELTPEEQSRLPEFSNERLDLPPLFQEPLPGTLTPLPIPDASKTPPPADGLFSDPLFNVPLPNFSFPIFPQTVPVPPPVAQQPPADTKPPEQPPVVPETEAETTETDDAPRRITLSPGGLPILPEGSEALEVPSERLNPPRGDDRIAANQEATESDTTESPVPEAPAPARSNEEIIAALRQDVEARRREIAIQRQLAYNPSGTEQDPNYHAGSAWAQWMQGLEAAGVNLSNVGENNQFPRTAIELPFPAEACEVVQRTVSTDIGVVIDAEGKPAGDFTVLRSSGYEFFNNVAGESILASTFENPTGKNIPYQITATFSYTGESCAGNTESITAAPNPNG
jgi:hypothetical protein